MKPAPFQQHGGASAVFHGRPAIIMKKMFIMTAIVWKQHKQAVAQKWHTQAHYVAIASTCMDLCLTTSHRSKQPHVRQINIVVPILQ